MKKSEKGIQIISIIVFMILVLFGIFHVLGFTKIVGNAVTEIFSGEDLPSSEEPNEPPEIPMQTEKTYVYGHSGLVASVDEVGEKRFYVQDHLGSNVVVLNEDNEVVEETLHEDFGAVREHDFVPGEEITKYKYTGKEFEDDDLYYYGARFYNPEIGRFISADSVAGDVGSSQTLNRYVYVSNNPLKYVDPSGNIIKNVNVPGAEQALETLYKYSPMIKTLGESVSDTITLNSFEFHNSWFEPSVAGLYHIREKKVEVGDAFGGAKFLSIITHELFHAVEYLSPPGGNRESYLMKEYGDELMANLMRPYGPPAPLSGYSSYLNNLGEIHATTETIKVLNKLGKDTYSKEDISKALEMQEVYREKNLKDVQDSKEIEIRIYVDTMKQPEIRPSHEIKVNEEQKLVGN